MANQVMESAWITHDEDTEQAIFNGEVEQEYQGAIQEAESNWREDDAE